MTSDSGLHTQALWIDLPVNTRAELLSHTVTTTCVCMCVGSFWNMMMEWSLSHPIEVSVMLMWITSYSQLVVSWAPAESVCSAERGRRCSGVNWEISLMKICFDRVFSNAEMHYAWKFWMTCLQFFARVHESWKCLGRGGALTFLGVGPRRGWHFCESLTGSSVLTFAQFYLVSLVHIGWVSTS